MTRILHHKLAMYKAVKKVCTINSEVWNDFDLFSHAIFNFEWELNELAKKDIKIQLAGEMAKQKESLLGIIDKLLTMCKVHMQIFPYKVDNLLSDYCLSRFAVASSEQQISYCYELYHKLHTFEIKHDFTVIHDLLSEFKSAIYRYEQLIKDTLEQEENNIINIDEDIPMEYDKIDQILTCNMDKFMLYFKKREPSFYAMYFQARSIEKYFRRESARA